MAAQEHSPQPQPTIMATGRLLLRDQSHLNVGSTPLDTRADAVGENLFKAPRYAGMPLAWRTFVGRRKIEKPIDDRLILSSDGQNVGIETV